MKSLKIAAFSLVGSMLVIQQAYAVAPLPPDGAVPEMDGSGAVIAIGLVIGLVALVREKIFRK